MKKMIACLVCFNFGIAANAQIVKPKEVAKEAGTNTVNGDIRSGINNGVDKANSELKGLFKRKKTNESKPQEQQPAKPAEAPVAKATANTSQNGYFKAYNNYDFVPGDRVVFEDNFADDQDGEFPAHWQLGAGQGVLNKVGDYEALLLTNGNFAHVSPLIKGTTYLTDTFTIEFDSYTTGGYGPHLFFYASNADAKAANNDLAEVNICGGNIWEGVNVTNHDKSVDLKGDYPADLREDSYKNKWHHVAIAYRNHQLKVYVDQYRIIAVPNLPVTPRAFDMEGIGDAAAPIIIANVKVANGGNMNMYSKKFTDSKIITHGINFDIDKASIKPESMGTLNMIVKVMTENPDVKFEVDGHTDNSGAAAHNATLSQQRAEAVKAQLIAMGIDGGRLSAKGFGDSKPISSNATIEGKANNRRVEFIKK